MSFESVNYPNYFLKYFDKNPEIVIDKLSGTKEDNAAATWIFEVG